MRCFWSQFLVDLDLSAGVIDLCIKEGDRFHLVTEAGSQGYVSKKDAETGQDKVFQTPPAVN